MTHELTLAHFFRDEFTKGQLISEFGDENFPNNQQKNF